MKASLTDHAIRRYRERVHPGMNFWEARVALLRAIREVPEPRPGPGALDTGHRVELAGGVTVIANRCSSRRSGQRWVIVTCLRPERPPSSAMADALADAGLLGEAA